MKISGRKGSGYIAHNNREFTCRNVDPTRSKNNIYIKKESLEKAYDIIFGESFKEYNESIRKDRRFNGSYLQKLRNSKNTHKQKESYEWIAQIGDKEDMGYGTGREELARQILIQYTEEFIKRNSQLYVYNAVIHMDEATPHVHIDYIPWARFKKGQKIRQSLDKAYEQMGYGKSESRTNNNTIEWQKTEREIIRETARGYGLEIEEEQRNNKKHLSVDEYKEMMEYIETLEQEIVELKEEIVELHDLKNQSINELAHTLQKMPQLITSITRAMKISVDNQRKNQQQRHFSR